MKKYFFVFIAALLFTNLTFSAERVKDEIHKFLIEYSDGKPTGTTLYIEITIYKIDSKVKWIYNETRFDQNVESDDISIDSKQSRSNDDYSEPILKDVVWSPGKKLQCKWMIMSEGLNLVAVKDEKKEFDWNLTSSGMVIINSNTQHKIEYRSAKKVDLKRSVLRLVNLYFNN
jgi:hypothetical protein